MVYAETTNVTPSALPVRVALEQVLRHPAIWRADPRMQTEGLQQAIPTTHAELDRALPEQGWPIGALTELLVKTSGIGELSLLTPALKKVCDDGRGIALLAPPHLPQARAWQQCGIPLDRLLIVEAEGRDLLWSAEQVLRSGECGAVVLWGQAAGKALNHRALQRLHLAASTGRALCFTYRPIAAQSEASPAPLRLRLVGQDDELRVHVIKCRGITRATPISLELFPAHWSAVRKPDHAGLPKDGHRDVLRVANEPSRHFIRVPTTA